MTKIDQINARILRALSDDGRISNLMLAERVGLSEHTKAAQLGFEKAMQRADEVSESHNVAGAFEYMLRVEVADLPAYKAFHTDILGTVPHVRSITSYMVMGSPKDVRA